MQSAKAIMLNGPLPTSVKDLYKLRNEMAVELLSASGSMNKLAIYACACSNTLLFI